jgi:hypothetical protein
VLILRLALRAIRWRAAASATVVVVAVIAVLAATVGPIYLHAVDQTVLARHLKEASLSQRDVLVSRQSEIGFSGVDWDLQVRNLAGQLARTHLFARPLSEREIGVDFGGRETFKSELASVEDLCAHVRIIRGRCVSGNSTDETMISANTAAAEHLTVGRTLLATAATGTTIRLHVAGVYRPIAPSGSFWEPWGLFLYGQVGSPNQPPPGDASFVTTPALTSHLRRTSVTFSANVALLPGHVRYDDVGELRRAIARLNATVAHLANRASTLGTPVSAVTTSLPTVLDQTATETSHAGDRGDGPACAARHLPPLCGGREHDGGPRA